MYNERIDESQIVSINVTRPLNITTTRLDTSLYEAMTSSWSLNSASLILISGQVGFTLLELAQTHKKNRDYIVIKNMMVFLTGLLTWFCAGYAIAFGVSPDHELLAIAGFTNGWFGDLSGGIDKDNTATVEGSDISVKD